MPSITQLEYILAIDQFRNFSKAAKFCHVAQPSLSIQVAKLEDQLDLIVFDRSKKPLLPTEEGVHLLKQARVIINEYKKLFLVKDQGTELRGEFKLAIIPTLAPYLLPLFLEKFTEKHPKVKLILEEMKTENILEALAKDRIDAGLLVTPLKEDQIIERVLFYEDFYLYASEDHPILKKKKVNNSDIDQDGLWLLEEGHCFRDQVQHVCQLKKKRKSEKRNISFESGNLETLIQIINKGKGFTLLPHLTAANLSKKEKDLHLRPFSTPIPSREVSLVSSRIFYKEKYLDALEEIILKEIPSELNSPKKKSIVPIY